MSVLPELLRILYSCLANNFMWQTAWLEAWIGGTKRKSWSVICTPTKTIGLSNFSVL
jgi:hypothetical protein